MKNDFQEKDKENIDITNLKVEEKRKPYQKTKKISKLLKKARVIQQVRKLTQQLKQKLKKCVEQDQEKPEEWILMREKKQTKIHKFVCYKDQQILDEPRVRQLLIHRRIDNDVESDQQQLSKGISYLHSSLVLETNHQSLK